MTAKNDITGALIQSIPSKQYQDNYDAIFRTDNHNQLLNDPIDGFNQTSPREEKELCQEDQSGSDIKKI